MNPALVFSRELIYSFKENTLVVLATLAIVTSLTFLIILASYESESKDLKMKLKKAQDQITDMELRVLSIHALNFITPHASPRISPRNSIYATRSRQNSNYISNMNPSPKNSLHSSIENRTNFGFAETSPTTLPNLLQISFQKAAHVTEQYQSKMPEVAPISLDKVKPQSKISPLFPPSSEILPIKKKEVRIWMDGAFDMMHYGHMNAFRQGKSLGTKLIVGVNSDDTITTCKGKPVFNDTERIESVKACKWVDEIVEGVPYIMNEEYLNYVIEHYKIDFVVHGDDPCIVNGKDVYETAKKLGKYRTVPRTEFISTTDLVGRMLQCINQQSQSSYNSNSSPYVHNDLSITTHSASVSTPTPISTQMATIPYTCVNLNFDSTKSPTSSSTSVIYCNQPTELDTPTLSSSKISIIDKSSLFDRKSNFLTTTAFINLFSDKNLNAPKPGMKIVYVSGGWDMLHSGHIHVLKEAKRLGDYVIVGVYNDQVVNLLKGHNFPILSLNERVLSVLGCKYVDDVLIDAPYVLTKEIIQSLHISIVLTANTKCAVLDTVFESTDATENGDSTVTKNEQVLMHTDSFPFIKSSVDPFQVAKEMNILQLIEKIITLSVQDILEKVKGQREVFEVKFHRKNIEEKKFYVEKYNSVTSSSTNTATNSNS